MLTESREIDMADDLSAFLYESQRTWRSAKNNKIEFVFKLLFNLFD